MKYFTKELWAQINSSDEELRTKAEKEWSERSKKYGLRFEKIKKWLSCSFLKDYLRRNGLHDYTIIGIEISASKKIKEYSCKIKMTDGVEIVSITMSDLKSFQIDISSFQCCMLGKLTWGYSEFDFTHEKHITLAVLCDLQNEMMFEFDSIRFENE